MSAEEYPFLASTALDKINNMIALLNESSESSHDDLAERLSFRFSEVIDFILNSDRVEKCPSVRTIGCFNFEGSLYDEMYPVYVNQFGQYLLPDKYRYE